MPLHFDFFRSENIKGARVNVGQIARILAILAYEVSGTNRRSAFKFPTLFTTARTLQ